MDRMPRKVIVEGWSHPRIFEVIGDLLRLDVVIPGCNCATCIQRLIDVAHTLQAKKIVYDLIPNKPDGWIIQIDLPPKTKDPIKYMSESIGRSITIDG